MNQLTEYRREFHKYPENGWREFRTSARVAEILTGMGYDVAMGPDVIEPGSVGEPERLSEEQIRQEMGRAVRQGAELRDDGHGEGILQLALEGLQVFGSGDGERDLVGSHASRLAHHGEASSRRMPGKGRTRDAALRAQTTLFFTSPTNH